jgi:hypothetical protein
MLDWALQPKSSALCSLCTPIGRFCPATAEICYHTTAAWMPNAFPQPLWLPLQAFRMPSNIFLTPASTHPAELSPPSSGPTSPNSTTAMLQHAADQQSTTCSSKDAAVIIEDLGDDELDQQPGWHSQRYALSLPEAHASIKMPAQANPSAWRMLLAFAGCGSIISVGYM